MIRRRGWMGRRTPHAVTDFARRPSHRARTSRHRIIGEIGRGNGRGVPCPRPSTFHGTIARGILAWVHPPLSVLGVSYAWPVVGRSHTH